MYKEILSEEVPDITLQELIEKLSLPVKNACYFMNIPSKIQKILAKILKVNDFDQETPVHQKMV